MRNIQDLLDCLEFYKIEVLSVNGKHVKIQNDFEIEMESNGMYKLLDDGYIVAPFGDLNELCRFILT